MTQLPVKYVKKSHQAVVAKSPIRLLSGTTHRFPGFTSAQKGISLCIRIPTIMHSALIFFSKVIPGLQFRLVYLLALPSNARLPAVKDLSLKQQQASQRYAVHLKQWMIPSIKISCIVQIQGITHIL